MSIENIYTKYIYLFIGAGFVGRICVCASLHIFQFPLKVDIYMVAAGLAGLILVILQIFTYCNLMDARLKSVVVSEV